MSNNVKDRAGEGMVQSTEVGSIARCRRQPCKSSHTEQGKPLQRLR